MSLNAVSHVLLCPPTHYDIRYEINPWMSTDNPIDRVAAHEAYRGLTYAYRSLGIRYEELAPDPSLPDQIYTTDLGHPEKNTFIKANFKYPERQKEADIAESYFRDKGFDVVILPPDHYFEGGDFLKVGDVYFFGYGKRSSYQTAETLRKTIGKEIVPIELPDEYFYHLDTCFAPLSPDVALIVRSGLTAEGFATLSERFKTIIEVNREDSRLLACNLITHGKDVIMSQGVSDDLKDRITDRGFRVVTIPIGEYLKGGGGIHCVSLEIFT